MHTNIKIKEILNIKEEKEIYTKATITDIVTKITKTGIQFYIITIADELKILTVCLAPEYFEQEIKKYPSEPITDDGPILKINDDLKLSDLKGVSSSMKIKCVKHKNKNYMNYFLCNIEKTKKLIFKYETDSLPNESNYIIKTRESLENIHDAENYEGHIDYKIALENISLFEELYFQDISAEITLYNLTEEIIDIYKQIFEFIANGGYLISHTAGIVKRHSPEKTRELKYKRKVLKDLKHFFHGCFVRSINFEKEQEISSLIFDERVRLLNTNMGLNL